MSIVSARRPLGIVLTLASTLVLVYILIPLVIVVATSFSDTAYVLFPPHGFTWRWYAEVFTTTRYLSGFTTSLWIAGSAALISLFIGVPAAYGLVRYPFRGSKVVEALFLSPLMLPGLVLAVGLTIFFAQAHVELGGWRLVLAHLTICTPCVLRIMLPAFSQVDRSLEEAALNLGALPVTAFLRITLPAVRSALFAAAGLAFILSFDEVDMSVFLASPRAVPLTVVLYSAVQNNFDPTLTAVCSCLAFIALAAIVVQQLLRLRSPRSRGA